MLLPEQTTKDAARRLSSARELRGAAQLLGPQPECDHAGLRHARRRNPLGVAPRCLVLHSSKSILARPIPCERRRGAVKGGSLRGHTCRRVLARSAVRCNATAAARAVVPAPIHWACLRHLCTTLRTSSRLRSSPRGCAKAIRYPRRPTTLRRGNPNSYSMCCSPRRSAFPLLQSV